MEEKEGVKRGVFLLYIAFVLVGNISAQQRFVSYTATAGALLLNAGGEIPVYVDANDERGVRRAAVNVMADLKSVCQADCRFTASPDAHHAHRWHPHKQESCHQHSATKHPPRQKKKQNVAGRQYC